MAIMSINGYLKIEFQDEILYFDGDNLEDGGCIELQPCMSDNGYSFAYLTEDGKIMQRLQEIGTIEDIKLINGED